MTGRCPATLAVAANRTLAWLEHEMDKPENAGKSEQMRDLANDLRQGLGTATEAKR